MILNKTTRRSMHLQSMLFVVLFLLAMAMLAWLSQLYSVSIDLTKNERNSLSAQSIRLLKVIKEPLKVRLFITPGGEAGDRLIRLFDRYQDQQPLIEVESFNPDLHPGLLREYDIRQEAEVIIEYAGRIEKVSAVTEGTVSNSIQRLIRQGERWAVFLQGHGERNPYSDANHDFGEFAKRLTRNGYTVENLNLTQVSSIPQNTDVLIVASPQIALLEGEVDLLNDFVEQGGNLLWLADPNSVIAPIDRLAQTLNIEFLPGIIVDPNSQLLGLNRVDFALVAQYPRHPITQNIDSLSLYPETQAIDYVGDSTPWQRNTLLVSSRPSWNEIAEIKDGIVKGDSADERNGPLNIGITLSAKLEVDSQQRIAVIGDADFLSNRYLGNGANLELGLNLLNWLSHDDQLISISPRVAADTQLELSNLQQIVIGVLFLFMLPLGLLGCGLRIWFIRRKR